MNAQQDGATEQVPPAGGAAPVPSGAAELARARASWREGDAANAEAAARRLLENDPQHAEAELILARVHWRRGDTAGAEAAARRALSRDPKLSRAELILARARAQSGDRAAAEEAARRALALDPQLAEAELIVARCRLEADDPVEAEAAASRALALNPEMAPAAMVAAEAAGRLGELERMIANCRRLADLTPDSPRWPLKIVAALDAGGRRADARRELDAVLERWPSDRLVESFLAYSALGDRQRETRAAELVRELPAGGALDGAAEVSRPEGVLRALTRNGPRDSELRRPIVIDRAESDVLLAECPGSDTAVFIFTGTNDRVGMPLPLFDRYLAALGVSAVYLKDFRRLLFTKGVQSFGDGHEKMLAELRAIKGRLGAVRLCTFGNSGGARAAIRCGVELGADRIVGISTASGPQPCLAPEKTNEGIIGRQTLRHSPARDLDLKEFLETRSYGSTITLVYRRNDPAETASALRLSGLAGVGLRPVAGSMLTVLCLAAEGRFGETLAGFFGLAAPPRS